MGRADSTRDLSLLEQKGGSQGAPEDGGDSSGGGGGSGEVGWGGEGGAAERLEVEGGELSKQKI